MAETASIIKINGVEMPTPSKFRPRYKDYDSQNSGRSEKMVMTRDIVRENLRAVDVTWIVQTPVLRAIIAAVKPPELELTFFDINQPADTQYSTITCYADPSREPTLVQWYAENPEESWWEYSTTFTEY